jgi:tRNA nucleotidyltransferase (CCA-adding enzyme)
MYSDELTALLYTDPAALAAYKALANAGAQVYIVGGAVRDVMLGKTPKDIDLMAGGISKEEMESTLSQLSGRLDFTGKQFGVYRYREGNSEVEIALPRTETSTGPAHTDFDVAADPMLSPEEDLARRDFTANAMAFDLSTGQIIDPHGGAQHINDGVLSVVSPTAFSDDPLRIIRAFVARAKHGLEPDEATLTAIKENADQIRYLPPERIQMELDKLLASADPSDAIKIAAEAGALEYMLPEVAAAMGFDQKNRYHDLDVGAHSLQVLKKASELSNDPDIRLAALLHDIGKPDSFWQDEDGNGHFYKHDDHPSSANHEELGADMGVQLMKRLRYPNARIERVEKLIRLHMFKYFNNMKGARKFLKEAGDEKTAWDLFIIRESDASGKSTGEMNDYDKQNITVGKALLQRVLEEEQAFSVKDLAVNGKDLLNLGIPAGPEIGRILNYMLDAVIENPSLNTKDQLLAMVAVDPFT